MVKVLEHTCFVTSAHRTHFDTHPHFKYKIRKGNPKTHQNSPQVPNLKNSAGGGGGEMAASKLFLQILYDTLYNTHTSNRRCCLRDTLPKVYPQNEKSFSRELSWQYDGEGLGVGTIHILHKLIFNNIFVIILPSQVGPVAFS